MWRPEPRSLTVLQAIARSAPAVRRRYRAAPFFDSFRHHARAGWSGAAATLAALLVGFWFQGPQTLVATRLELQPPPEGVAFIRDHAAEQRFIAASAAVLDEPATRLAALRDAGFARVLPALGQDLGQELPGQDHAAEALRRLDELQSVRIVADGQAIEVLAWHRDKLAAQALDHALVAALLARQPDGSAAPGAEQTSLQSNRARLATRLDAVDRQAATLSQSLTAMAHDMVEALRATENRSASTEVSDQGAALLAELQLRRVQMASKYQDGFPALVALDGEIAQLGRVVARERNRSSVVRSAADPVFTALASERRRVGSELEKLNTQRESLHGQIEAIDRQLAAVAARAPEPPHLVAGPERLQTGPDPRLVSLPLIALAGVLLTAFGQWVLLRRRQVLVTPIEVEIALGLPVLRCLDREGAPLHALERPILGKLARSS